MKKLLFYIALFVSFAGAAQTPTKYPLRYDSVIVEKIGGNGELIIRNATRSRMGAFLQNMGNGTTGFSYAVSDVYWAGDSLAFQVGPEVRKFKISAGGPGSAMTFAPPFLVQGDQVSLPGWNAPKWDSVYNWWKSNPLAGYYNQTQINQFFAGTLVMPGYNKTQWDNAVSSATLSLYLRKTQADSLYGTGGAGSSLVFSNGLLQTGNKVNALPDNALWNAKKWQGYLVSAIEPLNGQTPVFNGSAKRWDWGTVTADGIHVNVQPDYNETDTTSAAYIKNKPGAVQTGRYVSQVDSLYEWIDPALIGKRVILCFRSIAPIEVVTTGTPGPFQIKFESATGKFTLTNRGWIQEDFTYLYQ